MPRLQSRSFSDPDERREMPHGHAEVVVLDETTVGHATYDPGWRWSTHLAPTTGTSTCPLRHLGYSVSGVLQVELDDGQRLRIEPGSVYEIPAGHDAWVVGDEPCVMLDWSGSRASYVRPAG